MLTGYVVLAVVFGELLWHVPRVTPTRITWEFSLGVLLFAIGMVQISMHVRGNGNGKSKA
jgi:hypothetical protein